MRRFFFDGRLDENELLELPPEESRHISKVLRLGVKDSIILFNREGDAARVEITQIDQKRISAQVRQLLPGQRKLLPTILALSLLKRDYFELVIQKAVELGATEIVPFLSTRTVVTWNQNKGDGKIKRWNRIAREAAKQCGFPGFPKVRQPQSFIEFLNSEIHQDKLAVLFWEDSQQRNSLRKLFGNLGENGGVVLATGPEGGFSEDEVRMAIDSGYEIASMGDLILRSETAAIAALAALQFSRGRLGG